MALIILEGLDRTGKSSVAQMFENEGYEIIHMSAPDKAMSQPGYTGPSYLDQMVELLTSAASRHVVLDRSHYGELVWPQVYGRTPMLTDEDMEILAEIENTMDVTRILMFDPNVEAHWQRCVENNEPLTKPQFIKARALFSTMADKYGFERKTLKDFPNAVQPLQFTEKNKDNKSASSTGVTDNSVPVETANNSGNKVLVKTKEQLKLERANIINEVLEKRIIKGKGPSYDEVEKSVRHFLNMELAKLLGTNSTSTPGFSNEEVELLKFFCKRLKDKE
jgi:thymidylate kinase